MKYDLHVSINDKVVWCDPWGNYNLGFISSFPDTGGICVKNMDGDDCKIRPQEICSVKDRSFGRLLPGGETLAWLVLWVILLLVSDHYMDDHIYQIAKPCISILLLISGIFVLLVSLLYFLSVIYDKPKKILSKIKDISINP